MPHLARRILLASVLSAFGVACAADPESLQPFAVGEGTSSASSEDELTSDAPADEGESLVHAEGTGTQTCATCGDVTIEIDGHRSSMPVQEVDGRAVVEGDIIVGDNPKTIAGSTVALKLWPGGVIPYEIDSAVTKQERITAAVAHWRDLAGVRLVPRTKESDYVRFFRGSGCYSSLGRKGGKQEISLSDTCSNGSTIHEIGHTVGLYHEQSRSDRDTFVTVLTDNIDPKKVGNYRKTEFPSIGVYDVGSLMHYGSFYFALDAKSPAMTKLDGSVIVPNRAALSTKDVTGVRKMYAAEKLVAPASGTGRATTSANLSLRPEPKATAKALLVMPKGSVLQRLGDSQSGYLSVAYDGKRGWAYAPYVKP